MAIERILPGDREAWHRVRNQDVTASQVAALFPDYGGHEYVSFFELWASKTGRLPREENESAAIERGILIEPGAVALLKKRNPKWKFHHNAAENVYFRDPDARLGATPDVIVQAPGRGKGVIQIKSVEASIYRRKWLDEEGNVEPPFWIAMQASLEAYVTGATWAAVAPVVVGFGVEMPLIEVEVLPGVVDAMKQRSSDFWQMVREGREPPADYSRDAGVIDRLFGDGSEFDEVDLSADNRIPEILSERAQLAQQLREIKGRIEAIDAEVKHKMGGAHVAHIGQGRQISWKPTIKKGGFTPTTTSRVLRYPTER